MAFVPGWSYDHAMRASARLAASGRYAAVAAPTTTPRQAVSLSHLRLAPLEQGAAGTCYAHSPAALFAYVAKSLGYDSFAASRRLIAWATKQLEGGGNPSDGGSPTDAVRIMTSGVLGVAHESLCPYSDNANVLGQKPPQAAFDDAKASWLQVPIPVQNLDQVVSLIDGGASQQGHPVANGFQCPATMQTQGTTFIKSTGGILGGHSILITGYAQPGVFDQNMWLEFENWWGLMYKPLPPSLAKLVDGYEPVQANRTSSVWIQKEVYLQLCGQGCEHVSATDVGGVARGTVTPALGASFHGLFPA